MFNGVFDMIDVLDTRTLADGNTLELRKYPLSADAAEVFSRPLGSYEMQIGICSHLIGRSTVPKASHFVGEDDFRKLYGVIENYKDFKSVDTFLSTVIKNHKIPFDVDAFVNGFRD